MLCAVYRTVTYGGVRERGITAAPSHSINTGKSSQKSGALLDPHASMAPYVFATVLGGVKDVRVAGACTTGRREFGVPTLQIQTRRAASAPSPEGNTGNCGQN